MELLQLSATNDMNSKTTTVADFDLDDYIRTDLFESTPCDMPDPGGTTALDPSFFRMQLPGPAVRAAVARPSLVEEPRRGRPRRAPEVLESPFTVARRERNRQAAQRCRDRRMARLEELEAEIEALRQEKEAMMAELVRLGAAPSLASGLQ